MGGYNSRPHDFTISRPVAMYLLMPDVNYYLDLNGENTST
jgi:hypothetical protein